MLWLFVPSGVLRNFVRGFQQIQLRTEDRERGSGGGSPLVRGSGGSCNLVQEISYSKIFLIFGILRLFTMTTNLFVIANVNNCDPTVVLECYCLFFEHLGVLAS